MKRLLPVAAFIAAISSSAEAVAQQHPNFARYEYLWIKGRFIAPYTAFPEGRERGKWTCKTDRGNRMQLSCTFIRGSLADFDYIFKPR